MVSIVYEDVYINSYYSITGPYEGKSNIKFENVLEDFYNKQKTPEMCEVKMQEEVLKNLPLCSLIVGGDLSNQITTSSTSVKDTNISFLGVYNACATFIESIIIASNMIDAYQIKDAICLTSSHNLTSEKQFRYPVEYGAPKKETSTFTATGSCGVYLSTKESDIKVESATIGCVVDFGVKDANNTGAVMAPSAAKVLYEHLKTLKRDVNYYDLILTGDLGKVGSELFCEFLKREYDITLNNYLDAGSILYKEDQPVKSGASGPVVLPLVLLNKFFKTKEAHKILVIGTGSLHSPTLVNQANTIPSISHALSLEVK